MSNLLQGLAEFSSQTSFFFFLLKLKLPWFFLAACRLSCSVACEISVSQPGIKPTPSALDS